MSLINASYFVGEISIPATSAAATERLNHFIIKYEDKWLKAALGYELYKTFVEGITADVPDTKWTKLLYGSDYTYSSEVRNWPGLLVLPYGLNANVNPAQTFTMIVGRGNSYDASADAASVALPPDFHNADFSIERRGTGDLRADEYSVIDGSTLILVGSKFNGGETFFYKKNTSVTLSGPSTLVATSPIANYVYYYYMRDQVTQTVAVGEVATKAENSVRVSPGAKMCKAWNDMVSDVRKLADFLTANAIDYPQWKQPYYGNYYAWSTWYPRRYNEAAELYQTINEMGI